MLSPWALLAPVLGNESSFLQKNEGKTSGKKRWGNYAT